MKHKNFSIHFFTIITIIILLASCKKGDTGSQGPAGPAGAANVFYADWFNVDYNAETGTNGDTVRFFATIPAPRLVDSIIARGEIKVYFNKGLPTHPDVVPLPYFDPIYFDPAVVLNPKFNPGLIYLSSNYNMGTFDENAQKRYQYRYIIIPGGTAGRAAPAEKTVNWDDYKEVQAYLGLKD